MKEGQHKIDLLMDVYKHILPDRDPNDSQSDSGEEATARLLIK